MLRLWPLCISFREALSPEFRCLYTDLMSDAKPLTAAVIFNPVKVDISALREAVNAEAAAAGWAESIW